MLFQNARGPESVQVAGNLRGVGVHVVGDVRQPSGLVREDVKDFEPNRVREFEEQLVRPLIRIPSHGWHLPPTNANHGIYRFFTH